MRCQLQISHGITFNAVQLLALRADLKDLPLTISFCCVLYRILQHCYTKESLTNGQITLFLLFIFIQ